MPLSIVTETVPLVTDMDGVVRIGKTRVTLDTVISAFLDGATAEEVVHQYPSLNLADVYADENFNNDIVRGLLRRKPDLDIVRLQDVGLSGADDPTVLEWAAWEGRVLLTHDVTTMTRYAHGRIQAGKAMHGILEVSRKVPIMVAIEEDFIIILAVAHQHRRPDYWIDRINNLYTTICCIENLVKSPFDPVCLLHPTYKTEIAAPSILSKNSRLQSLSLLLI